MGKLEKKVFQLRIGSSPKLDRLQADIAILKGRLEKRRAGAGEASWLVAADRALALAAAHTVRRRIDPAWKYLHEAQRQEVFGYSEAEVEAAERALSNEAKAKLKGWRQLTVTELVKPGIEEPVPHGPARQCRLAKAMQLRDEGADNRYFKLRLVQRQVAFLLWLFFLLLGGLVALLFMNEGLLTASPSRGEAPGLGPWQLLTGTAIGALGACFSGIVSLVGGASDVTIPERIASSSVTIARPAIGAASALAAMLLLGAGLLSGLAPTAMYAIAFAFGFSERLAIGALERVTSRS